MCTFCSAITVLPPQPNARMPVHPVADWRGERACRGEDARTDMHRNKGRLAERMQHSWQVQERHTENATTSCPTKSRLSAPHTPWRHAQSSSTWKPWQRCSKRSRLHHRHTSCRLPGRRRCSLRPQSARRLHNLAQHLHTPALRQAPPLGWLRFARRKLCRSVHTLSRRESSHVPLHSRANTPATPLARHHRSR